MLKLHMLILGATPKGRYIEQHDIFFGIATTVKDLIPAIMAHWPEAEGHIHVDAWREVTSVNGYSVKVVAKQDAVKNEAGNTQLFFLNLGGYKPGEFEEYHYKMLVACTDKGLAVTEAKNTAFYKHTGIEGGPSHIDDRYGVDVDDIYQIEDILPQHIKAQYSLQITKDENAAADELHIGYYKLGNL